MLSPLLYAIFTADLKNPPKSELGLYADDTAIISAAKQSNTVIRQLEKALCRVDNYFKKWKIKINSEKTQAILFKFNRARRRIPTTSLSFNGSIINLEKEVTYLGATLDEWTSFNAHIETKRMKGLNCYSAIYPLLHKSSKLSTTNKLLLYKAMIRPKFTYASPAWSSTHQSNINKLQRTQNKILKTIFGLPRNFPTHLLHTISNIDDIGTTLRKFDLSFRSKCISSDFEIIRRLVFDNQRVV